MANEWDLTEAVLLYEGGMTSVELAERYGLVGQTVLNRLRAEGVEIRKKGHGLQGPNWRKLSPEQEREAICRYEAGESHRQLAKAFSLSKAGISHMLHRHGVQMRDKRRVPIGRKNLSSGYVGVWIPEDHPMAEMRRRGGYVLEHRLVMAEVIGRPLRDDETVHHKDGDKTNNALGNLELMQGKHGKGACFKCLDCGSSNVAAVEMNGN